MANSTFLFFKEQILNARKILILVHQDPDGDAVGSSLALKKIIENNWKKNCSVFFSGKINVNYKFKEDEMPISKEDIKIKDFDLLIILDTNNLTRTGIENLKDRSANSKIIIIDHHIKKGRDLSLPNTFYFINSKATATCEIILDMVKALNEKINSEIAFFLLLGIYTDSGAFFHSNTKAKLILKVRDLLSQGVIFKNIVNSGFKGKKVSTLKLIGKKISEAKINTRLGFIYSHIKNEEMKKLNIPREEIGGLVNLLNMCQETKFSLLLIEQEDGRIKASLRSSADNFIDVNIISRFFGGGGHRLASGFETFGKIVENGEKIKIS